MQRLVTFGCSHTYGHGLADCLLCNGEAGDLPSQHAWPSLLSQKLKVKCANLAERGCSNKQIWKRILDADISQTDTVVIMWTYIQRSAVFMQEKTKIIGPWAKDKASRLYYKHLYNDRDSAIDLLGRANHVKLLLDRQGITNLHLSCLSVPVQTEWNEVCFLFNLESYDSWPRALDNSHFGVEVQQDIAIRIHNILSLQ